MPPVRKSARTTNHGRIRRSRNDIGKGDAETNNIDMADKEVIIILDTDDENEMSAKDSKVVKPGFRQRKKKIDSDEEKLKEFNEVRIVKVAQV